MSAENASRSPGIARANTCRPVFGRLSRRDETSVKMLTQVVDATIDAVTSYGFTPSAYGAQENSVEWGMSHSARPTPNLPAIQPVF